MSTASISASPPPALPSVARTDFPSWLPATLVKELRQGLRTKGFVGTFIGFQTLMAILMISAAAQSVTGNPSARAASFSMANGVFWTILVLQLLVFTPGRALGGLQLEVSSRTIDLLMLTRLDAWRIVTGKWASLVAQSTLLLIAMLPYGIVRYFAGSVDLANDAIQCAELLGGSALLTAGALWGAGMGKVFRLLAIAGGVMTWLTSGTFFSAVMRPGGPLSAFGGIHGAPVGLLWLDGALLLLFFLVAAVRNIAPRAENHALLARLLPLIALVPVPVTAVLVGASPAMGGQLIAAGVFLLVVCGIELASVELPLSVHFRAALKRTALPRVFLRMTLPGWPSAFLYALFVTTVWLVCAMTLGGKGSGIGFAGNVARFIWIMVLALAGLVFPSVLLSLLQRPSRVAGGIYIATLAAAGALMPIGYAVSEIAPRFAIAKTVAGVLPVASFITALTNQDEGTGQIAAQALIAVAVIAVALWRSRPYWEHLAQLEARAQTVP